LLYPAETGYVERTCETDIGTEPPRHCGHSKRGGLTG
jgi:hypothetical protein